MEEEGEFITGWVASEAEWSTKGLRSLIFYLKKFKDFCILSYNKIC